MLVRLQFTFYLFPLGLIKLPLINTGRLISLPTVYYCYLDDNGGIDRIRTRVLMPRKIKTQVEAEEKGKATADNNNEANN